MRLIAGLDFGTSGVKLVITSPHGAVAARAQQDYPTTFGVAGEAEQDCAQWWSAAAQALAETGLADQIDAIGVTGQMQDLILVGAGSALRPALLYSDTRAAAHHRTLRGLFPDWEQSTGNHQDVTNVAAKIAWISEHEPHTLAGAEHLLFGAPGYFAWRAAGVAVCDVLTASTTGLLDVSHRRWHEEIVTAAGARNTQLPQLVGIDEGDERIGVISAIAAAELGVRAGIPLVVALGDAGSTTDGLIGATPGDAYLYLGTTGWVAGITAATVEAPSPIHSLVMPGWDHRLRIGAVQSAGSAADWARRRFFPGMDFDTVENLLAERVGSLATRPLCLPGLSGERTPVRDGDLRGAFIGVQEGTDAVDFYLSVLTGIAMGLKHAANEMGITQPRIPLVGGAADSSAWRRILADVFGSTIVTGDARDPGCHSAVRAVLSACTGTTLPPLLAPGADVVETLPSPAHPDYAPLVATHRGLYEALTPTFHALAGRARTE